MGKSLACKDVGVDCDFVIKGKDDADVMAQAAKHAAGCHSGIKMTPDVVAKVKSAIKEDAGGGSCCGGSSCH